MSSFLISELSKSGQSLKALFNKVSHLLSRPQHSETLPHSRANAAGETKPALTKPATIPTTRQFSRDYDHFPMPSMPVTPETLAATPPHLNNQTGKPLIWAYIGKDDPTRGDSRGANGLAQEMARLMGGKAIYVDQAMLDRNFKYADSQKECLMGLIERSGMPDVVIGTHSDAILKVPSCKPTMVINNINESIDSASPTRTNLVPHDLTPEILEAAGREFREKHPELKGKLHTVMVSTFYSVRGMDKLALMLAQQEEATVYFCPNRRVHGDRYRDLVGTFCAHLMNLGIDERVRVIAPTFEEMREGYNPYRGLIAESDHIIQIGDSQSMVAEAVCTGRPLYLIEDFCYYSELANLGYVRNFMDEDTRPLPTSRLAPISVTTEVAGKLVEEFDRLARLRTLGEREKDDDRRARLEALALRHASAHTAPARKIA